MGLKISTNAGAVAANYYLGKSSKSLEKSMARLASGLRIARPSDDAGGLAVSMKLKAAINRLKGAELNIQNGISFLEVQDGILESVGNIVDRMSELKGLSRDVMKNANDQETYNREFKDLQLQLKDMIAGTFNGVSLFAGYASDNGDGSTTTTVAEFDINGSKQDKDHTIDVYTSADGSAGAKVSIHKALAWSALTFNSATLAGADYYSVDNSSGTGSESDPIDFSLAADANGNVIDLADVSVNVFLNALENVAALRAQNGSTMSRLEFQEVNLSRQRSNMEAAVGRITDVDMGAETTRMAKYNVLRQASAAMLAQANQAPEVVMMLIR
jgi:flagellin